MVAWKCSQMAQENGRKKYLCRKCLCARESREWGETKKEERGEKRGRESDRKRVNESSRREKNKTSNRGAQGPK